MLELDLKIVLDDATETGLPRRGLPVRGWYLPTTNLAEWIETLNDCLSGCLSGSDYRLFMAPTSVRDIRASGLIYLSTPTEEHNQEQFNSSWPTLPASARPIEVPLGAVGLVGLRSRGGQVEIWMPSNARSEPDITMNQLASELDDCEIRTYVWLPSVGLIAFEPIDAFAPTSLLRAPARAANTSNRRWNALPDLEPIPDRIIDIIFPTPAPLEHLFEQQQDEIGGDSDELTRIDDRGNSDGQGILGKLQELISRQVEKWISEREKRQQQGNKTSASGKPVKGSIGQSLSGKLLNQMSKVLQSQRDKQLDKLLKLLQTDPDKALRFAIPLAAMSAFRGLGRSSNRLTERTPDFSLSKLFGSGPVDPWAFNEKIHNQLGLAYRKQAERELAAGRFRRAAYIHAHLLGDLTAAATILERGKAFREAAVIYGEKLNRPRDQARCLALAGQPSQAAQIYEDAGDFEAAARVWEDFADKERASVAYAKAVKLKIANHQFLAAAKLLDEKLDDRPRAESLLWEQWPDGQEVLDCAELGFRWFAERGQHDQARDKLEKLVKKTEVRSYLLLAKLSAGLARNYPDRELRETAEDRCRVVAGVSLGDVSQQGMIERLELIRSLQTDDVLLRRDTIRFEDSRKNRARELQPVAVTGGVKLNPLPSLRLPELGEYLCGEMLDGDLFALACDEKVLYGVRAAVIEESKLERNYVPLLELDSVQFLQISYIHSHSDRTREILLSFQGALTEGWGALELQPPARGRPWLIADNPLDVPDRYELCGGFGQDGTRWSVSHDASVLHGYGANLVTCDLPQSIVGKIVERPGNPFGPPTFKMLVVGNSPIISMDGVLVKYAGGTFEEICDLGCTPNCMAPSFPHTAPRIAIATDHSLKLVWLDRGDHVETLCDDERFTHVCFMHGGRLLATTGTMLHVYNIYRGNSKTVLRLDRQPLRSEKVVAVVSITAEVVGVLYQNGVIERYRLN